MAQTRWLRPKWRVFTSHVAPWSIPVHDLDGVNGAWGRMSPFAMVTIMTAILTVIVWMIQGIFTPVNIALIYLLPVLISAVRWGVWPSFCAAVLGVIAFDFFFVPPLFTYTVSDIRYLISFAVYLAVATLTASLASRLRQQARDAKQRESIMSVLYGLSRQVSSFIDIDSVLQEIVRHAAETFGLPAAILLPNQVGLLVIRAQHGFDHTPQSPQIKNSILHWVYTHGNMAGYGSNKHNDASLLYVPLKTEIKVYGVMCIGAEHHRGTGLSRDRIRVVEALAGLVLVSIARISLEEEAKLAHLTAESERLRTALLDSISHELRTPITTIIGAVTGVLSSVELLSPEDQRELLFTIREGAMRMNRLVTNLLGMVRLESGMLRLNKQWCDMADIIGVVINQVQDALKSRTVTVQLPNHLPAIAVDDVLIEQVMVNLLSNAIKYSTDRTDIEIKVIEEDDILRIQVRDQGIGIQTEEAEKIFEKFYRSGNTQNIPGTGLGLAICKGIVNAHGGEIFAEAAGRIGTIVTIKLPIDDAVGELGRLEMQGGEK